MLKILICDDDEIFLKSLKKDILKIAGDRVNSIEIFKEKEQLDFYIADSVNEVNVAIIDIKVNSDNGIDIAREILETRPNCQIIFVSAYDEYFLKVYSVDHIYFLKKPVEEEQLEKALRRAGEKLDDLKAKSIVVKNRKGIHRIPFADILYFEKEKRRIHINTAEGVITYYGSFEELGRSLDERFVRCHNSYIVNIYRARELSERKFRFGSGKPVPVSKTYFTHVRDEFLKYLGIEGEKE